MAIYDPIQHVAGLSSAPSFVKALLALVPGAIVTGATALISTPLVVDAAPLFAIGALGTAAIIMGFFVRADRR